VRGITETKEQNRSEPPRFFTYPLEGYGKSAKKSEHDAWIIESMRKGKSMRTGAPRPAVSQFDLGFLGALGALAVQPSL
jgi:hypothetical protein